MKLKVLLFVLMISSQNYGMEDGKPQDGKKIATPESVEIWQRIPDELMMTIFCLIPSTTIKEALEDLTQIRLVDKRCAQLAKSVLDIPQVNMFILVHAQDSDYQEFLSRMMLRAARDGDRARICLLAGVPKSRYVEASKDMDDRNDEIEPVSCEILVADDISFLEFNLDTRDEQDTVLILASRKGHTKIIKELFKTINKLSPERKKEYINTKGFGGDNAFLVAAKRCIESKKNKESKYLSILRMLGQNNADVEAVDAANLSAMDWAVKEGKVCLITILLDLGAHFSIKHKEKFELSFKNVPKLNGLGQLWGRVNQVESKGVGIQVELQLKNEPYWLSFKIDDQTYRSECENQAINLEFADKIIKLDDKILIRVGHALVEKVVATGAIYNSIVHNTSNDPNDYGLAFLIIFGEILNEPRWLMKKNKNLFAFDKIKEIVKPIFKAYPKKDSSVYYHGLEDYQLAL